MFLSIIIPTWRNTEEEIRRCLDSIDQSAWRDFEVLLVDDGNEAAYATMLDGLAETYPMLRVFHVTHGGVSAARNFGVEKAVGEYILFVDADDIVTRQFWHDVAEIAEKGCEADVIYGLTHIAEETAFADSVCAGTGLWALDAQEKRALYAHFFALQRPELFSTKEGYLGRGPCARILRRDFVKKFSFSTDLAIGEDIAWNLDMLSSEPIALVTKHIWYAIRGNLDSATRGYRKDLIKRHRQFLQVLRDYVTPDTERDYACRVFESLADIAKRYYLSPKNSLPWSQKVRAFNEMAKTEPFNVLLEPDWKMGGGVKPSVKLALYKAGLLLYAYRLKMLLRR